MVNVPTAVWINEQGRIVRPNEVAYVDDRYKSMHRLEAAEYLEAIRDWAANGDQSAFALSEKELKERLAPQNPDWARATAEFGLAEYLYRQGQQTASIKHYKEAQRLNPDNWNYKRQAWAACGRRTGLRNQLYERSAEAERQAILPAAPIAGSQKEEVGNCDKPRHRMNSAEGIKCLRPSARRPRRNAVMENSTNGQSNGQPTVVRTERGLSVAGTRITLYAIMDFVKKDYSPQRIAEKFLLPEDVIADVLRYIEEHREQVEGEYQLVLKQAEELRRYHEEKLREHLATRPVKPPKTPEEAAIRAKLAERKALYSDDDDYLARSQSGR